MEKALMKSITKLDKKDFNKNTYIAKINKCSNIEEDEALIERWKSANAYTWPLLILFIKIKATAISSSISILTFQFY